MLVYIVSDQDTISSKIRQCINREGLECPGENLVSLDSASDLLNETKPDLVVIVLGTDPDRGLSVMAGLRSQVGSRILAVGPASDPKLVIRALRSGADDYIDIDDLENHLKEALPRCREFNPALRSLGRVIAILAPSGGSGSSTLATNVAAVLAQEHKQSVLIDMKLEAGDLAALLDLKPEHTLSDLCQSIDRVDQSLFQRTLTEHSTGVRLLAAPRSLADVHFVTADAIRQILKLARAGFRYVIVDLDHSFRDEQAEVLRQADVIFLVLRMDFTALRNTRRTLDYLESLGVEKKTIRLVINRYGQAKEVPAARAEEALGVKIFHYVPDDPKTVNRANNNGVPMVLEDPWAKISQSITKLAMSVDGWLKIF